MGINRTSTRSLASLSHRQANSGFGGRLREKRERFALSLYIMTGGSRRIWEHSFPPPDAYCL